MSIEEAVQSCPDAVGYGTGGSLYNEQHTWKFDIYIKNKVLPHCTQGSLELPPVCNPCLEPSKRHTWRYLTTDPPPGSDPGSGASKPNTCRHSTIHQFLSSRRRDPWLRTLGEYIFYPLASGLITSSPEEENTHEGLCIPSSTLPGLYIYFL